MPWRTYLLILALCCTALAQTELAPQPCGNSPSGSGATATQIRFINQSPEAVKVYWINFSGAAQLFRTLGPTEEFTQNTFNTQIWRITDPNDQCLMHFVAIATPNTVARIPDPTGAAPACRLRAPNAFSEGPTNYIDRLRPSGTIRALIMFVDFPDVQSSRTTQQLYDLIVPRAVTWMTQVSNGKVTLVPSAVHQFFRMPKNASAYGAADGFTFNEHKAYITDALNAGDASIDYSQYDAYYIVSAPTAQIPLSPTFVPFPGTGITVDGKEVRHVVTFGNDVLVNADGYPAWIMAHETGHLFGLPDLYQFGLGYPNLHQWVGSWDIMGWIQLGPSFNVWHQWKLLWLNDTQVNCVGNGQVEETLQPSSIGGTGLRALIVPVSETKALVAEVRTQTGLDSKLCDHGLLLYSVDSSVATGQGPIRVINGGGSTPNSACGLLADATFRPEAGKLSTYTDPGSGVAFTILARTGDNYTVRVNNPVTVPGAPDLVSPVRVQLQNSSPVQIPVSASTATGFAVSASQAWIQVTPNQNTTPATLTVQAGSSLAPGSYSGFITLSTAAQKRRIAVEVDVAAFSIVSPSGVVPVTVPNVTIQWTPLAGSTHYDLRVTNGGNVTFFTGQLTGANSTSTVVSLPASGGYTLSVRPCTGATCGAYVNRNFTVQLASPPAAPTIQNPAEGAILVTSTHDLRWTAVPNATLYEIALLNQTTSTTDLFHSVLAPGLATTFSMRSGQYRLEVRACQAACGPPAVRNFTVILPSVPTAAPAGLNCNVVNISSQNQVSCTWSAVPGADLYQVRAVQPPPAGPGGGALTVASNQVSSTVAGFFVPNGQTSVVVQACNGDGCGPHSGAFAINPSFGNPAVPIVGEPVAGSAVNGPPLLFTWNRIPGDNGSNTTYRLYVQDFARQQPALDVYTTGNFWGAQFAAGRRYDALVIANPNGPNPVAGPPQGFVTRGNSPFAPTLVQPAHQSRLQQGNVKLGWTPVPGGQLYQYYVARPPSGTIAANGVTTGLEVQVPMVAVNGADTGYSGIVRVCLTGISCSLGSETGWGQWSNATGGPGVTNFTIGP